MVFLGARLSCPIRRRRVRWKERGDEKEEIAKGEEEERVEEERVATTEQLEGEAIQLVVVLPVVAFKSQALDDGLGNIVETRT